MRVLPQKYNKNGYQYEIVWRSDDICIVSQSFDNQLVAYETFEVLKLPEAIIMGNPVEAREGIPSSESWGTNAFTTWGLDRAHNKVEIIKELIKNREHESI